MTSLSHGHCLAVSGVVDGFFVVLVLGVTVAEWWCALRIRRYAANLARESELLDEKRDDERNGHRKSSSLSSLSPV